MAIEIQSNAALRNEAVRPENMYRTEDNAAIEQQRRENSLIGEDQRLIDEQNPPPPPPYTLEINRQMQQEQSTANEDESEVEVEQPAQVEARPITNVGANVQNLSSVLNEDQTSELNQNQSNIISANAIKSAKAVSE